jgi:hypothetical protein
MRKNVVFTALFERNGTVENRCSTLPIRQFRDFAKIVPLGTRILKIRRYTLGLDHRKMVEKGLANQKSFASLSTLHPVYAALRCFGFVSINENFPFAVGGRYCPGLAPLGQVFLERSSS